MKTAFNSRLSQHSTSNKNSRMTLAGMELMHKIDGIKI